MLRIQTPCDKKPEEFSLIPAWFPVFLSINNHRAIGKIINIGSGKPLEIKKIIQKIVRFYKKGKPLFGKIKLRKEEMCTTYPDISKAKMMLKWKPIISFNKGLLRTVRYYNES